MMEPSVLSAGGVVEALVMVVIPGMMSLFGFEAIESGCRSRTAALKLMPELAPI